MSVLDCEESWALKNWCFWTVVLEKTLESPLDCKEIQPVHSEGDQPWDYFGRNDTKAETPVLWPPHAKSWLIRKDSDAGRDWGQEQKGTTEDEMAGWHHRLNGRESEWTLGVGWWTGRPGVLWFMGLQRVGHDWATELNWTESKLWFFQCTDVRAGPLMKKTERRRIDAFKLWSWRFLRVPWTARRSNQSILKETHPECSLEGLMLKLKLQYFDHLMWRADSLEKTLMLGKVEGRRKGWQDEMIGWRYWLKGHEFEQALGDSEGQGSLACCSPYDWTTAGLKNTNFRMKQLSLYHCPRVHDTEEVKSPGAR